MKTLLNKSIFIVIGLFIFLTGCSNPKDTDNDAISPINSTWAPGQSVELEKSLINIGFERSLEEETNCFNFPCRAYIKKSTNYRAMIYHDGNIILHGIGIMSGDSDQGEGFAVKEIISSFPSSVITATFAIIQRFDILKEGEHFEDIVEGYKISVSSYFDEDDNKIDLSIIIYQPNRLTFDGDIFPNQNIEEKIVVVVAFSQTDSTYYWNKETYGGLSYDISDIPSGEYKLVAYTKNRRAAVCPIEPVIVHTTSMDLARCDVTTWDPNAPSLPEGILG